MIYSIILDQHAKKVVDPPVPLTHLNPNPIFSLFSVQNTCFGFTDDGLEVDLSIFDFFLSLELQIQMHTVSVHRIEWVH